MIPESRPQRDKDGTWRCCGHAMRVLPYSGNKWQATAKCVSCHHEWGVNIEPVEKSDPFQSDDPRETLNEYQNERRDFILDRDRVGRRYRRGIWSQCPLRGKLQEWHAGCVAGDPTGLIISGGIGTGKTVATVLMTACLASQNHFSFSCWNIGTLLSFLHNTKSWGDNFDADGAMQNLRNVQFLFLDDLGVEYNSPFAISQLNDLIEIRYSRELHHVCTSNLNESELSQREGWARMIDRIQESCFDWCELGGESKRRFQK